MKWLAIDTSGKHLTVILNNGSYIKTSYITDTKLQHSTTLLVEIEKIIEKSNISLSDIDVFACVVGPGSFTGIRIGISTCKAFSYALNKKVLPITSFETLAYNSNDKVVAIIDAKHDNFYAQCFENQVATSKASFIDKTTLLNLAKTHTIIASESIEGLNLTVIDIVKGLENATTNKLNLASDNRDDLVALYVKKSQAQEELK